MGSSKGWMAAKCVKKSSIDESDFESVFIIWINIKMSLEIDRNPTLLSLGLILHWYPILIKYVREWSLEIAALINNVHPLPIYF